MKTISLVYISLSGNTESFVTRLKDYLLSQYEGIEVQKIHIKDLVKEGRDVEILTTPVGDFIAYGDNASKCFGVVGSGNRNFNNQYCLTAKQYSQRFGFPVLADFEMRGMLGDIKRVAAIIADLYELES